MPRTNHDANHARAGRALLDAGDSLAQAKRAHASRDYRRMSVLVADMALAASRAVEATLPPKNAEKPEAIEADATIIESVA